MVLEFLEPRVRAPFVEIAEHGGRVGAMLKRLANRAQLAVPVAPHQPEVDADDADPAVDHRRNGAARLKAGQDDALGIAHHDALAHQDRVAVPADRDIVHRKRDRHIVGVVGDHLARQRGRAGAKPLVGLLQDDHVGADMVDHVENTRRIAATVEANGLADIVACQSHSAQPQYGVIGDGFHPCFGGVQVPQKVCRTRSCAWGGRA